MKELRYILVTAARDEEEYLPRLLEAVAAQTLPPRQWVIVSDGSTDGTAGLVQACAREHPFVSLLSVEPDAGRNFGSKARAINAGYDHARATPHDYVGILDADVSFEPDYFALLLQHFEREPRLGIAGGALLDFDGTSYSPLVTRGAWSVSGAVQTFRRSCFEDMGGYRSMRHGGVDAVAEVMARKNGWNVHTIPSLTVHHHRPIGTAQSGAARAMVQRGIQNHALGYHPLFMLVHAGYRLLAAPPILGSALMLAGYAWSALRRAPRDVPEDFVRFLRKEQMGRLVPWLRSSP